MSSLAVASNPATTTRDSLYITLQYLRIQNGRNQYHWALYNTGGVAPAGHLIHATDTGRAPLDLYREIRNVSNPLKSSSMVVCLRIAGSPGMQILDAFSRGEMTHLMDPRYLPRDEPRWTCRVWVKEVLGTLHNRGHIRLPKSVDQIEQSCIQMADRNMQYKGRARVFNDQSWLTSTYTSRTTPMEIDSTGYGYTSSGGRYLGSKPMVIDSTGDGRYYEPKPMITETYRSSRR